MIPAKILCKGERFGKKKMGQTKFWLDLRVVCSSCFWEGKAAGFPIPGNYARAMHDGILKFCGFFRWL